MGITCYSAVFQFKDKTLLDEIFLLLRLRGRISNKWALLSNDHKYHRYFLRTALGGLGYGGGSKLGA